MGSFPKSVANNFYDQPLPKYLDSKTVLIYCPHPVFNLAKPGSESGFELNESGSAPGIINAGNGWGGMKNFL
jgi:hypothetical protein